MNTFMKIIGFLATLVLAAVIPYYILVEPVQQEEIKLDLQTHALIQSTDLYAQNCAVCHGAAGEGIGTFPALNAEGI
ncbi:MAG TPA: c-type cytochrome, partial [Anaerolineales bacterium]|nr:c-type cytochrome [Anaerolineales bacterium]